MGAVLLGAIKRYNFQNFPEKLPLSSEGAEFSYGTFKDAQIDKVAIHSDGVIAESHAGTDLVEEFLDDFYEYLETEFSFRKVGVPPDRRFYESTLVVELDGGATEKFDFLRGLYEDLESFRSGYGIASPPYALGGLFAETEWTEQQRNARFTIERRIKVPFSANQWYSAAPLRTKDHAQLLSDLEKRLLA